MFFLIEGEGIEVDSIVIFLMIYLYVFMISGFWFNF